VGLSGSNVAGNVFNGNFFSFRGSRKAGSSMVGNAGSCGLDMLQTIDLTGAGE
jgi:hypothetical protein